MAKHVIKADRNTQWVVDDDGDSWRLEKQATLNVDPGPAVMVAAGFDKNKLVLDGDIVAAGASASEATAIYNDGDRNTFVLHDKAEIQASQGMAGTGDHTTVINRGSIAASGVGIAQNQDFSLVNTNHISGSYGISVAQARLITNQRDGEIQGHLVGITLFGDGASEIVNKGQILGSITAAIQDGDGTVAIRNTGVINGDIDLGGGSDLLVSLKGEVNGTVYGGDGNDVYRISQSNLFIVEAANEGNDAVYSTVDFTLWSNIEGLVFKGRRDIDGAGNASDNEIVGNKGDNTLYGVDGEDVLTGYDGNDTMTGGTGGDNFLFTEGFGKDVIIDFEHGLDLIGFVAIKGLNDVGDVLARLDQHGADVWIETKDGRLILESVDATTLDASDFGVLTA